jgi:hypothetical protein
MRGSRNFDYTEKVGGALKGRNRTVGCARVPRGYSSGSSEKLSIGQVSPEASLVCAGRGAWVTTPLRHRVQRRRARSTHRRVAQREPTVRRQKPSPIRGCGTPVATAPPQTVSRLQSGMATDSEDRLHPSVVEGRNTMLRRGRCAGPLCEAVPTSNRSSERVAGELKRKDRMAAH